MATGGHINTDILSDEIFDVLCSICVNQGINTEADKFCVDCHDYFCVNCVKVHSKVPLCASHKVLDKSQVKSGTSKGLLWAPAERCDRHSHKHIDMYCHTHDKVGCSTCVAVDHRSCQDTFYIPDYIQNKTYQFVSSKTQTKLMEIIKTLEEQADRFKQDKHRLLKRKSEILAHIRKFRQEINDQLDKLEKSSVTEIEDKVNCLEDLIEEGLKQLQANKVMVTSVNGKLTPPNTDQAQVFVNVKMGEEAADIANKCIEDAKMKSTVAHIEFQPDRTILTQLEKNKTIGTLTEPRKTTRKVLQTKGQHPYFVNIKVNSDEDNCYITSACCMEDGMIILADDNNKKLKKLHSQNYTVIDHCDLLEAPWQVCVINKAQVAVTVPSQKEVQFISIETPMETIRKINTDFACYGIAYANRHIYISDDTSVYMCTMSGRKVKRFSIDQSIRTILSDIFSPFFSKPSCGIYSIAASKDATRIYVVNADNGLIVLDNNGRVIKIFNGQQLKWANCCYLTEAGSVLVSGENSNNVLQFTSDGELIGEVIKANSGERRIRSICCNQQMSKMCICRLTDNNIEMFNI